MVEAPTLEMRYIRGVTLNRSGEKPGDDVVPDFNSANPVFFKWESPMVEGGFLWIAFDGDQRYGIGSRYYIDTDCDGRLDDETAVVAKHLDRNRARFSPVKLVFAGEDGPVTYHLLLEFNSRGSRRRLSVRPGCWYEGQIDVGGLKRDCKLYDYNTNGTFDDKSYDFNKSDRIMIGRQWSPRGAFVGDFVQVDGQLYELEVARDGAYVALKEAEDVLFGEVQMQEGISEFAAGGENGLFEVEPQDGKVRLPVGDYKIHHWSIEREDKSENRWELTGSWSRGGGAFWLLASEPVSVDIGEPIAAKLDVSESGGNFGLKQVLEGRLGERITITRNGARANPPRVHICSADGKYDRKFSFEYG